MKTRRLLKASRLVELGACQSQVKLFRRLFGAQVFVTVPRMVAVADSFDWNWGARNLLGAPALADYQRAIAPTWADYERARAPAWAEYQRAIAPASADYQRATAAARADYERARAAALADYQRARAAAFARAYINDTVRS
mgnify:CR=1 FL=1